MRERIFKASVYMVLVHYPVLNREGEEVSTAITNLDIHDGGRLAATYGLKRYFLTSPIDEQRALVHRIREHWTKGRGAEKNPSRKRALERVEYSTDLESVCLQIEREEGRRPILVGTSARYRRERNFISWEKMRKKLLEEERPYAFVFGTGWGLSPNLSPPLELFLPPIWGPTDYNHLSVRAAMAITLDRLLGLPEKYYTAEEIEK